MSSIKRVFGACVCVCVMFDLSILTTDCEERKKLVGPNPTGIVAEEQRAIGQRIRPEEIGSFFEPIRASVISIALFKLVGTGIFAAMSGINAATPKLRRSCALATSVNTIASIHYYLICAPTPVPPTATLP